MKKMCALIFVLVLAGCTPAPQTDLEGLKAMHDIWQSASDTNDAAIIAAIYSENGAIMPPNDGAVIGRAAIEVFFEGFQASGLAVQVQDTEVYAQGDVGYKIGIYTITDASGTTVDQGKYVEISRHIDGTWQMYRDIFNSDIPLTVPEPSHDPGDETEPVEEAIS